jgi:hypothetical protein
MPEADKLEDTTANLITPNNKIGGQPILDLGLSHLVEMKKERLH